MAVLGMFDYIFAFGLIFAFLDAWNIGANDVANSFATSVSSRSLTMKQAMFIATICEFGGAVLAGSRVADTIRNKVINVKEFDDNPSVLMLGMLCALVGSSLWLTLSTKIGLPVSTTHSIVGGIVGVGVAALGAEGVSWGWNGVSQIFAAWFIAPAIAGAFAIIVFMITKYGVLQRSKPLHAGLMMIPVYFGFTAAVLTLVIVWKGAASLDLDDWTAGQILGCTFGVAGGVVLLYCVFLLPFLYRRLVMDDWTLKNWEVIKGPLLWKRGPVPEVPEGVKTQVVQDYYRGHGNPHTNPILANAIPANPDDAQADLEKTGGVAAPVGSESSAASTEGVTPAPKLSQFEAFYQKTHEHPTKSVQGILGRAHYLFFRGVERDVVAEQKGEDGKPKGFAASFLAKDLEKMHEHVPHYDNKTEHLYSFLQVMTAATASFAHGANDVSNAIGPLAAIYLIWNSGETSSKSPVPIWILVFGGAAISIGLWTYGYNLMINLGNRLTLHSPSRGFSMELGAALTVILATRLGLPISTTQCITGATVGVGLCSGTYKAINWRMIAWIYMGWIITLPVAGIISGGLMGIIINAPRWGLQPDQI
ncbi:phosphate transporter [Periconia macrospinosa]|uniref:Phosphate transporter n=1 Tax=Periconia macrospinosa TaxID=97972 RepID=A0A2V1E8M1_9PLEO|nr:phosphate transporter [Periconia macrospinosa]